MQRVFVRLSIGIAFIACLFVGSIRLVGAAIPVPELETLQQFDCTPKPCWHGIHLGITSVREAESILSSDETIRLADDHSTPNRICWDWQNQWHNAGRDADGCYGNTDAAYTPVLFLSYANNPIKLDDIIYLWGHPTSSLLCSSFHIGSFYWTNMEIDVQVPANVTRIDPDLAVTGISYFSPQLSPTFFPAYTSWKGLFYWGHISADCGG